MDQRQRAAVGLAGLRGPTEAAQQLAPGRVQVAVVLEGEAVDDVEPRLRALLLGDRDGPVQLDDRRAGEAGELAVEGGDLGPVAGLVGVQRRDRRLHDVGAPAAQGQGAVERRPPAGDLRGVPARAVLVGEQHQVALAEPRLAAGVEQQHHRQQAVHLRLVGHQLGEARPSRIASAASSPRPP